MIKFYFYVKILQDLSREELNEIEKIMNRYIIKKEIINRNGVNVTTYFWSDGSRSVDSSCHCFGISFRTHSIDNCHLARK